MLFLKRKQNEKVLETKQTSQNNQYLYIIYESMHVQQGTRNEMNLIYNVSGKKNIVLSGLFNYQL